MSNVVTITPKPEPVFPIVKDATGTFVHQISEDFHPGFIRGESEAAKRAKHHLEGIVRTLTNLNVGRVKMDPNHSNQVNGGIRFIQEAITEARNHLRAEEKLLTDGLIAKSGFKPDPVLTSLVVGTFQQLEPNERVTALNKLIDESDGSTLAILDSVSGVFTGLTPELKASIRTRLFAKTSPHGFKQLEDAKFNLDRIERASIASVFAFQKFEQPLNKAATAPAEVHKSIVG